MAIDYQQQADDNSEEKPDKARAEKIIRTAQKRFQLAVDAEKDNREAALDDLRFLSGEQWPSSLKSEREAEKKPCITINRLPQFHRQVTNDQRQNRPAIQVNPVDDVGDPDTAEVIQGIIRHIEYDSNADVAYDTGFFHGSAHGRGYLYVITEYESPQSFNLVIKIKRIRNPFTVYMDPSCQEPDYSDANWGFIFETFTRAEYESQYPNSELAGLDDWKSTGDQDPEWLSTDSVRVATYIYKELVDETICLLSDGTVHIKSNIEEKELPEGLTVVKERKTQIPVLHWTKLNSQELLEETTWAGQWVPIVPILGDEFDINGKVMLQGIVRNAKDPQRMYNYWASKETESILLAPTAPWVAAEGTIEGYEDLYKNANVKNYAVLPYKPKTLNGVIVPPPQRSVVEPAVMAITNARLASADDLKATTGIYDAQLGARSNEQTGKAILARQHQGQISNFHYIDNLTRAIRHLGRILIDLIPKIYDTPRVLRIIGEDGTQKTVKVNQPTVEQGAEKIYDLTVGRYDVTVSAGPSYSSKRQEAVQSMLQLTQSYPALMQIAGDLMIKNMDWSGAKEIAERFAKTLPPELKDPEDGEQPIPPQAQQQLAQMKGVITQLQAALADATQKVETKQIEMSSKERIAFAGLVVELLKLEATLNSQEAQTAFKHELAWLQSRIAAMDAQPPEQAQGATA